jgi:hypothetical protein
MPVRCTSRRPSGVRVVNGGQLIVETDRALLVWAPRRIVPSYAVPVDDLSVQLSIAVQAVVDPGRWPAERQRAVVDSIGLG